MKRTILLITLLTLISPSFLRSQPVVPQNYFRSPVDFPITLSGSYGEIRPNHFHSGIDIRTGAVIGKPVYAAADGYVTRIFVSPWGFGKAIYIQHPNGYVTVYGHLDRFSGAIARWVSERQYLNESFAMDTEVPPGMLKVTQGQLIAYSGNAGSSAGPHLHFEIRNGATQVPLDPLAFGITVSDSTQPKIYNIRVIPHGLTGMVNFSDAPILLPVTKDSLGNFILKQTDTVKVSGNIVFGIEAYDFHDASTMRNGIRKFEMFVDDEKRFGMTIDSFSFADTRYVNSILDYPLYLKTNHRVLRSYIAPNDKLNVFDDPSNNGVINFNDNRIHQVKYVLTDLKGNSSSITFPVQSHPPANVRGRFDPSQLAKGTWMPCKEPNTFRSDGVELNIPEGVLYEDLDFIYSVEARTSKIYSKRHTLHNNQTPLHTFCDLSIRAEGLPSKLRPKALVVRLNNAGAFSAVGGKWDQGWMRVRIRDFGTYAVAVDTVAPVIKAVNIPKKKIITKNVTIKMKITDNLSGIDTYRGTLNGKWILMDFDAKRNMLIYTIDDRIRKGKNAFRLVVTDKCGNKKEYNATLTR